MKRRWVKRWAQYIYINFVLKRRFCVLPWWVKNVKRKLKSSTRTKGRHLKLCFQKWKQIHFWEEIILTTHKTNKQNQNSNFACDNFIFFKTKASSEIVILPLWELHIVSFTAGILWNFAWLWIMLIRLSYKVSIKFTIVQYHLLALVGM